MKLGKMKNRLYSFLGSCLLFGFVACQSPTEEPKNVVKPEEHIAPRTGVWVTVLGTVQDGGSPHIGCKKACCKDLFLKPDAERKVVSLGVVDYSEEKKYLFEASPDIATQMNYLKNVLPYEMPETPDGIFLTHAHIGHYTGLMHLGREALGSDSVPVYAMPKMKSFLEENGPWSQLVSLKNIALLPLQNDSVVALTRQLRVTPFTVPHRDEFSETVGYKISGPNKTLLFIPDINKWSIWEKDIIAEIEKVDFALIDATFYDANEVSRNIAEIPHPFVVESMELFKSLHPHEKRKIIFIHFNHTNPLINPLSEEADFVREQGFDVAYFGMEIAL